MLDQSLELEGDYFNLGMCMHLNLKESAFHTRGRDTSLIGGARAWAGLGFRHPPLPLLPYPRSRMQPVKSRSDSISLYHVGPLPLPAPPGPPSRTAQPSTLIRLTPCGSHLEPAAWRLGPGAWSLEPGAWSLEPRAWSPALRKKLS